MADLPRDIIIIGQPPFTITGCDCFGPCKVQYRRSTMLRYGCVFTCFSTHAIHQEKLDTLEADSFLNCLRRFIARRGTPAKIYSDNGTNSTSANKQMQKAYEEVLHTYCSTKRIEWNFIPPTKSHYGGIVWNE